MQKTKLLLQFNKLENARMKLVSRISLLEEKMLHQSPQEGKWSVMQIIFHLNSSEQRSIDYIRKKITGGNFIRKTSVSAEIRTFLLGVALRYRKYKKPGWLPEPPENADMKITLDAWSETRNQLKQLIVALPEDMIHRQIFRHPFAGRLNMIQALVSIQSHFDHHLKQINSLLKRTDLISS